MRAFRLAPTTRTDLPSYVLFAPTEQQARSVVKALAQDDASFAERIDTMAAEALLDEEAADLLGGDELPSGATLAHAAVRLGARAYLHPVLIEPPSSTVRPRG